MVAVAVDDPAVELGDGRGRVRRAQQHPSGRGAQRVEVLSSTSRPASITPTRWHSASTSPSRWLDSTTVVPPSFSAASSVADLADAARVEPVRRLVEQQQLGRAQQRGGDAEALAHAQRVGAHGAPVDPAEADAFQRLVDALPPAAPAGPGRRRR